MRPTIVLGVICVVAAMPIRQNPERSLRVLVVPLSPDKTACPAVSASDGLLFEVDGRRQGMAEWLAEPGEYAFISIDMNSNGVVDNATELVSDRMVNGTGAFNALADLDKARAGNLPVIDARHPLHAALLLWSDANRNGRSELSELRPASEFLAVIGLGWQGLTNQQRLETSCRYTGWSVTVKDWTGRPRPNDRLHPVHEVMLRTVP